jgi:hypothetical protein
MCKTEKMLKVSKSNNSINTFFSGIINDTCENENDCKMAVTHSICTDAVCLCVAGYDEINNGTECVKRMYIFYY